MIVMNHITGDSRVQKIAASMAKAGWDVYLLGRSATGLRETSTIGGAKVIWVPAPMNFARYRKELTRRGVLGRIGFRHAGDERADRVYTRFVRRDTQAELYWIRDELRAEGLFAGRRPGPLRRTRLRVRARYLRGVEFAIRARHAGKRWATRLHERFRREPPPLWARLRGFAFRTFWRGGGWRRTQPQFIDWDWAFSQEIDQLQPDIIHAHDITTIGLAARAARRVSAVTRRPCKVIYDAHELITGVQTYTPEMRAAYTGLEAEYIHRVDRVLTVSPTLARILKDTYRLRELPAVVTNCPPLANSQASGPGMPNLRRTVGLPDDVPVLVYSGWVNHDRGIHTMVEALQYLPGVHAVVVANIRNHRLEAVEAVAERCGVTDRFHVAPYVRTDQVVPYLSSATIGMIPLLRVPNHELSLITKYYEYMHARLPIVVSDVKTMSEFTRATGNGEVFTAGDPRSLAEAVKKVLADRDRYTAVYDRPGFLEEHCWERQEKVLVELYSELTGLRPEPLPPTRPAPAGRKRYDKPSLVIGPRDVGGQAEEWCRSVERFLPEARAEVITLEPVDHEAPEAGEEPGPALRRQRIQPRTWREPEWAAEQRQHIGETYSHVLFEGLHAITGESTDNALEQDLLAFRLEGLHTGIVLHPEDAIDPRLHRELHADSPFADAGAPTARAQLDRYLKLRGFLSTFSGPVFVTTPDLLDHVPDARWLPLSIDPQRWRSGRELFTADRPVVVYPATTNPLEDRAEVETVLRQLDAEGRIEYRPLLDTLPAEELAEQLASADIVLDEFRTGSYSLLAVKAMAAGRVVVGHVGETTRARLLHRLPIVEATRSCLLDALVALADDLPRARSAAAAGPAFVARHHDGSAAAQVLAEFLTQQASAEG
ncbi:hypothetical protein C3Y87_02340 [Carbonactinospora thermoautotrophica]|nr:hypothetical protein [Carbonactinospora thermoautotrophica]